MVEAGIAGGVVRLHPHLHAINENSDTSEPIRKKFVSTSSVM
jgi:hypothetical protein